MLNILLLLLWEDVVLHFWMSVLPFGNVCLGRSIGRRVLACSRVDMWLLCIFLLDLTQFEFTTFLVFFFWFVLVVLTFGEVLSNHFQANGNFDGSKHVKCLVVWVILCRLPLLLQLQLIMFLNEDWHMQDLLTSWPFLRINLKQRAQDGGQIRWVVRRYLGVNTFHYPLIQAFHVLCGEGRIQRNELIEDATEWPYVWLVVVGFVLPHLWTCIIWSSSLCFQNAGFCNFWNI